MTKAYLEFPALFRKFPNLEKYEGHLSADMVESLARNCRNLKVLTMDSFNKAYFNATFPELVKLKVKEVIGDFEFELKFYGFLRRHQKLTMFHIGYIEPEALWDLSKMLPNLEIFQFDAYVRITEDDLTKLLLKWKSIRKITIGLRPELDLKAIASKIKRNVMICDNEWIFAN
jgi:hypothetical protein